MRFNRNRIGCYGHYYDNLCKQFGPRYSVRSDKSLGYKMFDNLMVQRRYLKGRLYLHLNFVYKNNEEYQKAHILEQYLY